MALEILDLDASEVPEAASASGRGGRETVSRAEMQHRLERELRLRAERAERRMAD